MQIVIEIPKSEIPKQQDIIEIPLHFIDGKVCGAGGYGFDVLPKGHGRLGDLDYLYRKFVANKCPDENVLRFIKEEPTVIDADKGEDNEQIFNRLSERDKLIVLLVILYLEGRQKDD